MGRRGGLSRAGGVVDRRRSRCFRATGFERCHLLLLLHPFSVSLLPLVSLVPSSCFLFFSPHHHIGFSDSDEGGLLFRSKSFDISLDYFFASFASLKRGFVVVFFVFAKTASMSDRITVNRNATPLVVIVIRIVVVIGRGVILVIVGRSVILVSAGRDVILIIDGRGEMLLVEGCGVFFVVDVGGLVFINVERQIATNVGAIVNREPKQKQTRSVKVSTLKPLRH